MARWQAETFPKLRAEAKRRGAVIYFADEAGLRSDHHTGTTWGPRGQTPVVKATGRRFSLNMISAVSNGGDFRFMTQAGSVTAPVFRDFLQRLLVGATQPISLGGRRSSYSPSEAGSRLHGLAQRLLALGVPR